MEEPDAHGLTNEILSFVDDILRYIKPETDHHDVQLQIEYPESFDEEQRNLPLILNFYKAKKNYVLLPCWT